MAMPQPIEWTLEMLHELPDDGNRYELIDGELLVSPAPSLMHQRALGILHSQFGGTWRGRWLRGFLRTDRDNILESAGVAARFAGYQVRQQPSGAEQR